MKDPVPCKCEELEKYLKTVERMGQAYRDIYSEKKQFDSVGELNAEIGVRMGWTTTRSIGKGGLGAKPEEKKKARDQCLADGHCHFICAISIDHVHEKYHDWLDKQWGFARSFLRTLIDASRSTHVYMQPGNMSFKRTLHVSDKIISEIGAHEVEAEFLRNTIQNARSAGKCDGVQGTPSEQEVQKLIDGARSRINQFLKR